MRVAIVGGGFSGAVTAMHLARNASIPLAIDIIEPRATLGGGVAYSATDPAHRINVPASRMTVFADDPTQFDRWLRTHAALDGDPAALWRDGSAFPQRGLFGRYIAELVADAGTATPGVTIHHRRGTVRDIAHGPGGFTLFMQDGGTLRADLVVLAVSHPPPAVPAPLRAARAAGAPVIEDPWRPGALDAIAPEASVLVVGTGLTMADMVSTLDRRGHRGPIMAVSRRGQLSRGHAFGDIAKRNWFADSPPCPTALGLCQAVRAQVLAAWLEGQPWQAVFDDIRANARRLWAALDTTERRRLLRHLRPYWDVHRFRIAPQAEQTIARLRARGLFRSLAATLRGASWDGARLHVRLHQRGDAAGREVEIAADAVIVTTGPAHDSAIAANPALASLARAGLIRPDAVGLGLDVDASNWAIGADGVALPTLLVAGPLARGQVGELMGLPQVSDHAAQVAQTALTTVLAMAQGRENGQEGARRATPVAPPTMCREPGRRHVHSNDESYESARNHE
jgi:uncharacterized NAD(P)/FAD-binding protein YdhS